MLVNRVALDIENGLEQLGSNVFDPVSHST
jgi:hypothetical protein